jgi:aspartyl/asparaginyl-tRNA synthetase
MISDELKAAINRAESKVHSAHFQKPKYDPNTHIEDLADNQYFQNLLYLRDLFKRSCDDYMGNILGATNVDLFMLTTSISSPMGPGSDSEPLPIKFGDHRVYCYLPSMRGEDPDDRHLNQFFHCEAEITGNLEDIMLIVEGFVKYLASTFCASNKFIKNISVSPKVSMEALSELAASEELIRITFDEACDLLRKNGYQDCINVTDHGRDINSKGERLLLELIGGKKPVWIMYFDRDRVPFYQKPDNSNNSKVLCADLVFPPLIEGSFGGEIVGAGQRQDDPVEMLESLNRQGIPCNAYKWYIEIRRHPEYKITSGFGLGVERFIAWALCLTAIRDAIIYPREKNILAKP